MAQGRVHIYNSADIDGVRKAAQAAAQVRKRLCAAVTPGMTTAQIDMLAGEFIRDTGGKSCSLGYEGFPGQICISLNEEVVHGIGTHDRVVQPGDLVSLDITVRLGRFVGDCAATICAGMPAAGLAKELLETTEAALWAGIDAAREGNLVSDIGAAVEGIANQHNFGVVRDMVGHGCGLDMHEPPEVPNYFIRGQSIPLRAGMIICIEPMINAGTWRIVIDRKDGWTVRAADGSLSAHFENQVLITPNQAEVLSHA